jgi:hypothetical protein
MMLDDFLTALRQNILDRIANPLIISFIISWCLWNYKFIVILFSDASVTHTFFLIETIAFPSWIAILLKGISAPLASALFYVFAYPYVDRCIHNFLTHQRYKTYKETPLSKEEAIEKNIYFKNINDAREHDIKKLQKTITELTQEIENHKTDIQTLCSTRKDCAKTIKFYLNDLQVLIIGLVKQGDNYDLITLESELSKNMGTRAELEAGLDSLIKSGIIKKTLTSGKDISYKLTSVGRLIDSKVIN